MQTKLEKLHLLLIDLIRCLKYFEDVELTHGGDDDQVCLKYMKLSQIHGKPQKPVYDSSDRFVFDLCFYIEDATNLILVTYFCLYSASKLMLRTSAAQVRKKEEETISTETHIAHPPRQLQELQGQMKDI